MKLVLLQVDPPNFLIRHLPAGRVYPAIQTTGHLESPLAVVVAPELNAAGYLDERDGFNARRFSDQ